MCRSHAGVMLLTGSKSVVDPESLVDDVAAVDVPGVASLRIPTIAFEEGKGRWDETPLPVACDGLSTPRDTAIASLV